MSEKITLENIETNLSFFNKMYDAVRLIDPIRKCVLDYRGGNVGCALEVCYDYWSKSKVCDNCISIRAYHDNKSYMKLEYKEDLVMVVTAIPIETNDKVLVLELLKDVTDSMIVGSREHDEENTVRQAITKLNDIVVKDELTSLYNRRYISDRLPVDIVKATISDYPLSLIFVDLDNFKDVNDIYGHMVGDTCLKEISNIIQNIINTGGNWAARYGGDEFVICLNDVSKEGAYSVADKIRNEVETLAVKIHQIEIRITVSIGVHTMKNQQLTADEILDLADRNMYNSKKKGKNSIFTSVS